MCLYGLWPVIFITIYLCSLADTGINYNTYICNFDDKGRMCPNMKQGTHNVLFWEQGCGQVDPNSGPKSGDDSPCFLYIDADGAPPNDPYASKAILETYPVTSTGKYDISFSYSMPGKDLGKLTLIKTGKGRIFSWLNSVWDVAGEQNKANKWMEMKLLLNIREGEQLLLIGQTGGRYYKGVMAIDSFKVTKRKEDGTAHAKQLLQSLNGPSKKPRSFTCSFKGSNFCGIKQLTSDNFNWSIYDGYICAAGHGQPGARGKLELPVREDGTYILTFDIAASDLAIKGGALMVYTQSSRNIWSSIGKIPYSNYWFKTTIQIIIINRHPIIFEAILSNPNERIAVMDVRLHPT